MTQTYVQPKEIFSFQTHENHTQRKFSCPWKIMLKHPNKISTPIKIEFTQSCLHIKFSWFHTYSKNQVKIHLTMQSSTNHQYCPNLTISNNNSKMPKKKWPHNDFHPIRTISKISHKSKQQQNDNAHHKVLNKTWNQQIYQQQQQQQQQKKKWAHLEIFLGWVWSIGAWVLKESLFIISFYRWIILLPIECKKVRWSMKRCHGDAKRKVWKWVSKMGFSKMLKNLRI